MKRAIAIMCFAAIIAVASTVSPSSAAAPALTGKMAEMQYLVGTWACVTKVPAMENMAAHTDKGSVSFEIEPGNTVGYDVSSTMYSGAGFIGYVEAKNLWWSTGADNFGGVTSETGKDDMGNVSVMSGTTTQGGESMSSRDTITKTSNTKYRDLYEIQRDGKWTLGADSNCTKTSNTPG